MYKVLTMVSACDAKWVQHDGNCYKFVNQTWQYFGGAVAACNGLNAHLLHIGGSHGLIRAVSVEVGDAVIRNLNGE